MMVKLLVTVTFKLITMRIKGSLAGEKERKKEGGAND